MAKKQRGRGEARTWEGWSLERRGRDWVAGRREDGRRQRAKLGSFRTEDDAFAKLKEFVEAQKLLTRARASHSIGDLWTLWMADRAKDKFDNSIYLAQWVSLEPFFAHRTPSLLTADDCREYALGRFGLGRSSWTVNTELVRLRSCLVWAEQRKYIADAPYVWVPQRGKPREIVITPLEAKQLLAASFDDLPHVYIFIVLALTTAARHTAILELEWDRIDFERGLITYTKPRLRDPMSKTWKKGRATVPMNRLARAALERAFEARQTDHVVEYRGKSLKDIREGFAIAVGKAGLGQVVDRPSPSKPNRKKVITNITPHTIRHSVNSWLKTNGVEVQQRADLLGQRDIRINEMIYSHADNAVFLAPAVRVIEDQLLPGDLDQ